MTAKRLGRFPRRWYPNVAALNRITALGKAAQPNRITRFTSAALQPITFAIIVAVVEVEREARTPIVAAATAPVVAVAITAREVATRSIVTIVASAATIRTVTTVHAVNPITANAALHPVCAISTIHALAPISAIDLRRSLNARRSIATSARIAAI